MLNKIVAVSLIALVATACTKEKESAEPQDQNLVQCMESDPNPFLVELRKMAKDSPSAKLTLKQTCEELAKQLK